MNKIFTESDLEAIFANKRRRKNYGRTYTYVAYFFLFALLFVVFFLIINGPSVVTRVNYWYGSELTSSKDSENTTNISSSSAVLPKISNNSIFIERVGINAPVVWNVTNMPESTAKALESGVIHLTNTAHPGEIGNVFITGHSSNYIWAPGHYKSVFTLLPKIVIGDQIYIKYNDIVYRYTVSLIKTVKPDDISVLKQGQESVLTLVTCVPVGTSLNRLVILANQTYPSSSSNAKVDFSGTNQNWPSSR